MTVLTDSLAWSGEYSENGGNQPLSNTDALIARCLSGDTAAYNLLYRQNAAFIYRLTYGLLQNKEDAEEVLQDAFEYAFRQLHQFDASKSAFRTWLYRIAISRCRNKRRRKWLPTFSLSALFGDNSNTAEEAQLEDETAEHPEEILELTGRQQRVWSAIGQLSDKLRETAVLRYYDGLSYQEIAEILDVPAKTAESRIRLAHKELKLLLQDMVE
jgi:RNA polymerase sigma-70 factor (ECF subfamily)